MAALLDQFDLRRHALPDAFAFARDDVRADSACPRLRAIGHAGPDGRPVCAWRVDTDDPD